MADAASRPVVSERGFRATSFGHVLQLKICTPDYRPLGWSEVWEAFSAAYPDRWAVQFFPPAADLIDGKAVYHLFVLEAPPAGLNLKVG